VRYFPKNLVGNMPNTGTTTC